MLQESSHLGSPSLPAGTRFISFSECRSGAFHLPPVNFPPLPTKHMQYALLLVETRIIFDNIWGLVGRSNNNPRLVGLPQPPPRCYLMGSGLVPLQPFGGDERRHGRQLHWHQNKKNIIIGNYGGISANQQQHGQPPSRRNRHRGRAANEAVVRVELPFPRPLLP